MSNFYYLEKVSTLDWEGKLSSVIFTKGCPFRCPFCHNPELVYSKTKNDPFFDENLKSLEINYVKSFLKSRIGKIDCLVITGGEPLMFYNKEFENFLIKVKEMGYLIKIDTNGFYPDKLSMMIKAGLVDYIAMDIKNDLNRYSITSGIKFSKELMKKTVLKSIEIIMQSGVEYEFRTTVVPGLHDESSFIGIGEMISGADKFYIQNFRGGKTLDPNYKKKLGFTDLDLEKFENIAKEKIKNVFIRGV